ncbi:HAMP domain-containing histidine kinase [Candidatus Parcubacteria bacterium]|nr:HAMP domain-containing histidine kinase [Candidatus Parcubacteria bacterium]
MSYNFQSIAFDEIVGKAVRLFQKDAETRKLPLNYENAFLGPVTVNGDFEKLYEVVVNMLDNAVRYSAAGTIRVRLAPSSGGLILSVADQGIGIAPDDIPKLFNKFIRTEEAKKFRTDGMGIGLYFAKKIVADHRGRVWAESPGIGKGSTFSVELPVVG